MTTPLEKRPAIIMNTVKASIHTENLQKKMYNLSYWLNVCLAYCRLVVSLVFATITAIRNWSHIFFLKCLCVC